MENSSLELLSSTIKVENQSIWLKPVCDFFNIDYKYQLEVVRKDPILASMVEKNTNEMMFGDKRDRVLLPKIGFIRWIQLINANTVKEDLRAKFLNYQTLVFEYLLVNVEEKQSMELKYQRLHEIYLQEAQLSKEKKAIKDELQQYMDRHLGQLTFPFDQPQLVAV